MRAKKIKPFFIVFYHDLKHPNKARYEIWKEYDHTLIWDAPHYKVLGYFDDKQEAKQFVQQHKQGV